MTECDSAPAAVRESSQTAAGASAQASSTGSFEYAITVDERLCCPICQAPMQDPWMSKTCEHVYCYECIIQHLAGSDGAGTCPCDRSPLRLDLDLPSEKRQLVPALRLVKLLCDELPVRCTSSPSCKWTGQRSHWQRHYDHDCIRRPADACPNECGYRGKDVAKHQNDTCPRRPFECPACQGTIASSELKAHSLDCPQGSVHCPSCGLQGLVRSGLQDHIANVCPETEAICPHARFGCSWKGKRRLLRHDHLDVDCIFEPLKGVLNVHEQRIECLEQENSNLKRDLAELRNTFEDLEHRVERITNNIGHVQTRNDNSQPINQQLDNLIARVNDLNRTSTRSQLASEHTLHEVKGEMSNMHMMIHDLRGEFMALQHVQYYENAYRQLGRGYGPLSNRPAEQPGSSKSSDDGGDLAVDGVSHDATGLRTMATPQPGFPAIAYPFPPYGTMQPVPGGFVGATNAPYGMVPPAPMFGPRRWSGWPYSLGSSSPEERGGGVKL